MIIEIRGKTYHSVRIVLNRKTFDTPKRGECKVVEVQEIPEDLIELEKLNIIRINIK